MHMHFSMVELRGSIFCGFAALPEPVELNHFLHAGGGAGFYDHVWYRFLSTSRVIKSSSIVFVVDVRPSYTTTVKQV